MKSYLIFFVAVLLNSLAFTQNDQSVVAQIGKDKITVRELKLRMELSPYIPDYKSIYPDSIKYDFLYSLIAEKLWAKEAERLGYSTKEKFQFFFKPIEDLFVRDALFKKEVEEKVKLSANDVNAGIMKSQYKLNAQLISSDDSVQIHKFYHQILSSNNFDSLFALNTTLASKDIDVTFGTLLDEEIEDSLYTLNINQFTAPIKSKVGWIIFRIKNKTLVPIDLNDRKFIENNHKIIRERRIENRYKEYTKELLSGIVIQIDQAAFRYLNNLIWDRLKVNKNANEIKYFELSEWDFRKMISSVSADELNKPLFKLGDKEVPIKNFLSQLAFDGFSVDSLDSVVVIKKLDRRVKQFVEDQFITKEGYDQQVNLTTAVREDLARWNKKYLAQFYFNAVLDSIKISDTELYDYYLIKIVEAPNINMINVRLVNIKDLNEISTILDSLKQGSNFADIIKTYGKTDSLVNGSGETGLKPILSLGDVGMIASNLKLNEVYGPLQRNNSYTIMQVFQKENSSDTLKLSFDSVKEQLRNNMRLNELSDRLKNVTANLADKNNVKIYNDVLKQFEYSKIPMFIHRFMGFGGRIGGMPLVTPFSGWIDKTDKKKLFP